MGEWSEDDLVPLSAIQHFSYCPRQYALIHIEQIFDENAYTTRGRLAHRRVDEEGVRSQNGHQVITALPVWSDRYGLIGKCDAVEMKDGRPYPVEFKHGRRKSQIYDELQLCAQAMCLEEMFGVTVPQGAIYHVSSRRRREVNFCTELRTQVLDIADRIRDLRKLGQLPPAVNDERCTHCSLNESCMPAVTSARVSFGWREMVEQFEEGISWNWS